MRDVQLSFLVSLLQKLCQRKNPQKTLFQSVFLLNPFVDANFFGNPSQCSTARGKMLACPWGASADAEAAEREEKQ
jgi:hypothetical protein